MCYLPQPSVSAGSVDVADINVAVEADHSREDEQSHPPVATPTTVSVDVAPQPEASVHTPEPDVEKPAAASCGLTTQTVHCVHHTGVQVHRGDLEVHRGHGEGGGGGGGGGGRKGVGRRGNGR